MTVLFTELEKIERKDVKCLLDAALRVRLGNPELLHERLEEADATIEEVLCDVVLALLDNAAQANRESFRARQRKGFQDALEQGRRIGRPSQREDGEFARVRHLYQYERIGGQAAADMLGVSRGTFYRWLKEAKDREREQEREQERAQEQARQGAAPEA